MGNNEIVITNAEAIDAEISMREVGQFIRDKIIRYTGKKIAESAYDALNSGGRVIEFYDSNNYVKLMYRVVDNNLSYDEWINNKTKMDIDFQVSVNHNSNPHTLCGKVENLLRDIFLK